MRNAVLTLAIVAGLGLASGAFAAPQSATPPAPPAAAPQITLPTPPKALQSAKHTDPASAKTAACAQSWRAEKHHTGTRKAFMDACAAKA